MLRTILGKTFDVRAGEFKISLWMLAYAFLIIAVLLIVKPTVNAIFLSELGVEQLPWAFLLVAVTAILSSFFYTRALSRLPLNKLIEATLASSVGVFILLGILLLFDLLSGWMLYFFYVWVAIYALLSASQFWVMANLVFNPREAKRLFGFIGSGAILGGICGGYLTSLFSPFLGTEFTLFLAAILLCPCFFLLRQIWKLRVQKLSAFKRHKRVSSPDSRPYKLILQSRHLSFIAAIVAVSVLVAKLVDYLFSDFAAASIPDPDDLSAFFGFWFSTFNLLSLGIQLFLTRRIVGIWGVGFSLLLLPLGILAGSVLFLFLPELSAILVVKAMDGILKQSVHKSANEMLALPLPFDLKNRTKTFIDVVVDSIATGLAGFLLIFVVKGLDLPSFYIILLILGLVGLWVYFVAQVRKEYFRTYRENLEALTQTGDRDRPRKPGEKPSVVAGMKKVFRSGTEEQILFMLGKLMEINDRRFAGEVESLLDHPSVKVRTAAVQNLYFLNRGSMSARVPLLLAAGDPDLTLATLQYVLLHAQKDSDLVYDSYLDHPQDQIAETALFCLAQEARDNYSLKEQYGLRQRISARIRHLEGSESKEAVKRMLRVVGIANLPEFYPFIEKYFEYEDMEVRAAALEAAGSSTYPGFIQALASALPGRELRPVATAALVNYGSSVLPVLTALVTERRVSLQVARFIPQTIRRFESQASIRMLFRLLRDPDVSVRLEVVRALSDLRRRNAELRFDRHKVVAGILEECQLYHQTLSAMHSQIIISYRNRKRGGREVSEQERDARSSLLELLERRLDAGLERIFGLLGLKFPQRDVEIAFEGLQSKKQDARANAIDFLDNMLTGDLRRQLLPIIEEGALDITSEETLRKIQHRVPTERECFEMLLNGNDFRIKLAVLYLIRRQEDPVLVSLVSPFTDHPDVKIRTFAVKALEALQKVN